MCSNLISKILWSQNIGVFLDGEDYDIMLGEKLLHTNKKNVNQPINLPIDLKIVIVQIINTSVPSI
jgi:hypothetical protein